jgi:hypothetical protein
LVRTIRVVLGLKNAPRVVFSAIEDDLKVQFFPFAQKVDLIKGEGGHGHG